MVPLPFCTSEESSDTLSFERALEQQGFSAVCGSDEVGRGPLAGPVVAACAILPAGCDISLLLDSKKLTHRKLLVAYECLVNAKVPIGIGVVQPATIDQINILQASLLAMKRAVEAMSDQGYVPDYILVDGKFEIPCSIPQTTLIKGESRSASIAAASIIAKVTRDKMMEDMHQTYPVYGFAQHKGYPTAAHRKAIKEHGPCEIHRKTFKGVKEFVKIKP